MISGVIIRLITCSNVISLTLTEDAVVVVESSLFNASNFLMSSSKEKLKDPVVVVMFVVYGRGAVIDIGGSVVFVD